MMVMVTLLPMLTLLVMLTSKWIALLFFSTPGQTKCCFYSAKKRCLVFLKSVGNLIALIIIIIIIIITRMIFMVLSSWQSHCESSPSLFDECRLSAEVAANPQTKPTDLDCESARKKWQLPSTSTITILLLLSPRADTHFTVPQRVEG